MRPLLFKLPFPNDTSFYYSRYDCDYFERPWHFHKEFELVYIVKSKGTKFIGNQVQPFEDGDLTLIGADIFEGTFFQSFRKVGESTKSRL